ncbi:hypothetical protein A2635_00610 [Candidatus Peribacteria bacterium RIFCSPHIGHO2_01_FULL_51_9]|nr:MAG: hypothetical protein A2635_00610 [Candidatus Peribacteria bacterium RIFCSPHIGHO2_01_FULL_51_9]
MSKTKHVNGEDGFRPFVSTFIKHDHRFAQHLAETMPVYKALSRTVRDRFEYVLFGSDGHVPAARLEDGYYYLDPTTGERRDVNTDFIQRTAVMQTKDWTSERRFPLEGYKGSGTRCLHLTCAQVFQDDVRLVNSLEDKGIFTVRELTMLSPEEVLRIPNIGAKNLEKTRRTCMYLIKGIPWPEGGLE